MAEKNNRIDSRFSVVGAFWTPDSSEEDPDTGTVTSDERQITLTTAPVYKQVSPDDFRNLFSRGETQLIKTVHGFTADGICTLCQLIDVDSLGLTDTRINKAISATVFRVSVCLMGMHIAGLEDRCLDSARYTFSSWHRWLPRYVSETWEKDFVVLKVPMKDMDLVTVDIDDKPIKIRLKLGSELKSAENEAGRLSRSVAFLEVENTDKESLAWYLDIGNRLENLFSLLTGTSLSLQTMFLYRGEKSAHVNMKRNSNPGTFDYQDCVRCSPGQIGTAMKIWLTEDERFHSVESLALGVLRKGKLFVETEFLSLAQALEGFHRAMTNATSPNKAIIKQVRKKI